MTLLSATAFVTTCQHTLRSARDEGPTPRGKKLLTEGAAMLDGHEYQALPEAVQGDLGALYAVAYTRVNGGLV